MATVSVKSLLGKAWHNVYQCSAEEQSNYVVRTFGKSPEYRNNYFLDEYQPNTRVEDATKSLIL
jgi:hypothetical protein